MREIKFRGKRIDNGKWVYGDLRQDADLRTSYISGWDYYTDSDGWQREPYEYQVDRATVGQYTGLKDKNGVEIYEGDIFRTSTGVVAVVEWEDDARFLGFTLERERKIVYVGREPAVEVIGNIYENPELLGGASCERD